MPGPESYSPDQPDQDNGPQSEAAPPERQLKYLFTNKQGVEIFAALAVVATAAGVAATEVGEHYVAEKAEAQVPGHLTELITPGNPVEFYNGTIKVPEANQLLVAPDQHAPALDPASIDVVPQGEVLILNPAVTHGADGQAYLMGLAESHHQPGDPTGIRIQAVFVRAPETTPTSHATTTGLQDGEHLQAQAHSGNQDIVVAGVQQPHQTS